MKKVLIAACFIAVTGCSEEKTAAQRVAETTAKVYPLTADERSLAAINAKTYFEREWINADKARGQFIACRPSDSNFNGFVSCTGMVPTPSGTYVEKKMYCGYQPELVGCSDEDTVK